MKILFVRVKVVLDQSAKAINSGADAEETGQQEELWGPYKVDISVKVANQWWPKRKT